MVGGHRAVLAAKLTPRKPGTWAAQASGAFESRHVVSAQSRWLIKDFGDALLHDRLQENGTVITEGAIELAESQCQMIDSAHFLETHTMKPCSLINPFSRTKQRTGKSDVR